MTEEHIKEQLSKAYVTAVTSNSGVIFRDFGGIDYGIDGKLASVTYDKTRSRYLEDGFGIDVQLKASTTIEFKNGMVKYNLEVKTYKDLIRTDVGTPRILVLYSMPKERLEWVNVSIDEIILKKCAWWHSLKGLPDTANTRTILIEIPQTQIFNSTELKRLIQCVKDDVEL